MAIPKKYSLPEAAPHTGFTLGTLRQYVSLGIVEALKIGRKRFITEDVLERICTEGLDTTRPKAKRKSHRKAK